MATIARADIVFGGMPQGALRALDQIRAKTDSTFQALERKGSIFGGLSGSVSGLAGALLPATIGLGGLTLGFSKVFAAADQFDAAQRRLVASAKLAGQEVGHFQRIASSLETSLRQAPPAAAELTSAIGKLTARAGMVGKELEFAASFMDLVKAHSLDTAAAVDVLNLTLIGQDEGLNRLGLANPQQIYEQWAAAAGTTASKMNETQKALAVTTALMSAGGKVAGEFAKYLETPAGKAEALAMQMDLTSAAIGRSLNGIRAVFLPILAEGAEGIRKFVGGLQVLTFDIAKFFAYIPITAGAAMSDALSRTARFSEKIAELLFQMSGGRINVDFGAGGLRSAASDVGRWSDELSARVSSNYEKAIARIVSVMDGATAIVGPSSPVASGLNAMSSSMETAGKAAEVLRSKLADLDEIYRRHNPAQGPASSLQVNGITVDPAHLARYKEEAQRKAELTAVLHLQPVLIASPSVASLPAVLEDMQAPLGFFQARLNDAGAALQRLAESNIMKQLGGASRGNLDAEVSGAIGMFSKLMPLGIVAELIGSAMSALAPAINALLVPVQIVGEALGAALVPVLRILFPVFKGLGIAAAFVGEVMFRVADGILTGIGGVLIALGKAINLLPGSPGDPLIKAGRAMAGALDGSIQAMQDAQKKLAGLDWDDAAGGVDKLADAATRAAESLSNVPQIFDLALRRRMAAVGPSMGVGASGIGWSGVGPRDAYSGSSSGRSGGDVVVHIHNPPAGMDVNETVRQVKKALVQDLASPGASAFSVAVGNAASQAY